MLDKLKDQFGDFGDIVRRNREVLLQGSVADPLSHQSLTDKQQEDIKSLDRDFNIRKAALVEEYEEYKRALTT